MKKVKNIILLCTVIFALASCETYKDPVIEYSPVFPLSGEWIVRYINPATSDTTAFGTLTVTNTATNSATEIWVRKTGTTAGGAFTVKATCDVPSLTFSVTNGTNTVLSKGVSVGTCTITQGLVTLNGWNTNSGYKSDKITFKLEDSRKPGVVYNAEGYRRTGWYDDEP